MFLQLADMKKIIFYLTCAVLPLAAQETDPAPSVTELNTYLLEAISEKNWWNAIDYADSISYNFPTTPFAQESPYQVGYSYFQMGQFELANESLTDYLNRSSSHSHFEEAIQMKFEIAEAFRNGAKKPLFGSHKLPKWMPAKEDAIAIYDEVITTLPTSETAAKSLLGKGKVQAALEDYKPAIETLHTLIRRFPKHDISSQAFLEINKIYLDQSRNTSLDLDILDMAEVNLRKFKLAFPRDPRITEAEALFAETQELFAQNLLETGLFFERTKKIPASIIYFNKVVAKYPGTKAAEKAKEKLDRLE